MKLKAILFLFLLSLLLLFSSCSSSSKYGIRSNQYSEARIKNKASGNYRFENNESDKNVATIKKSYTNTTNIIATKPNVEFQKRNEIIFSAMLLIGTPYKYAGKNPNEGFDCSGFANFIFKQNGLNVSGPSYELALQGEIKNENDIQKGDMIFFGDKEKINHVGIVTENKNGKIYFIHSSTSAGIKIDEVFSSNYWREKFLFGRDVVSVNFKNL